MTHPSDTPRPSDFRMALHCALRTLRQRDKGQHNWTLPVIHSAYAAEWDLNEAQAGLLSEALEAEAGKR